MLLLHRVDLTGHFLFELLGGAFLGVVVGRRRDADLAVLGDERGHAHGLLQQRSVVVLQSLQIVGKDSRLLKDLE